MPTDLANLNFLYAMAADAEGAQAENGHEPLIPNAPSCVLYSDTGWAFGEGKEVWSSDTFKRLKLRRFANAGVRISRIEPFTRLFLSRGSSLQ
jgi:hypothetical protein